MILPSKVYLGHEKKFMCRLLSNMVLQRVTTPVRSHCLVTATRVPHQSPIATVRPQPRQPIDGRTRDSCGSGTIGVQGRKQLGLIADASSRSDSISAKSSEGFTSNLQYQSSKDTDNVHNKATVKKGPSNVGTDVHEAETVGMTHNIDCNLNMREVTNMRNFSAASVRNGEATVFNEDKGRGTSSCTAHSHIKESLPLVRESGINRESIVSMKSKTGNAFFKNRVDQVNRNVQDKQMDRDIGVIAYEDRRQTISTVTAKEVPLADRHRKTQMLNQNGNSTVSSFEDDDIFPRPRRHRASCDGTLRMLTNPSEEPVQMVVPGVTPLPKRRWLPLPSVRQHQDKQASSTPTPPAFSSSSTEAKRGTSVQVFDA